MCLWMSEISSCAREIEYFRGPVGEVAAAESSSESPSQVILKFLAMLVKYLAWPTRRAAVKVLSNSNSFLK